MRQSHDPPIIVMKTGIFIVRAVSYKGHDNSEQSEESALYVGGKRILQSLHSFRMTGKQ